MVSKLLDLQKYGWIHPPSPTCYIKIVQRISAISCGAAVGESPHSEEVIYVVYRYSIYSINEISLGGGVIVQKISAIFCGAAVEESPHSEEVI
jgi:hypothetical protein